MVHRITPHQQVRIIELAIAVPADAEDGMVRDEMSAHLSLNGTYDEASCILDWGYTGRERVVQADADPEEGEVFGLPALPGTGLEQDRPGPTTIAASDPLRALLALSLEQGRIIRELDQGEKWLEWWAMAGDGTAETEYVWDDRWQTVRDALSNPAPNVEWTPPIRISDAGPWWSSLLHDPTPWWPAVHVADEDDGDDQDYWTVCAGAEESPTVLLTGLDERTATLVVAAHNAVSGQDRTTWPVRADWLYELASAADRWGQDHYLVPEAEDEDGDGPFHHWERALDQVIGRLLLEIPASYRRYEVQISDDEPLIISAADEEHAALIVRTMMDLTVIAVRPT
ncbi:MAG: hypothetical protein KKB13_07435 [Chloroflexi bacterium]|nr:hypothetical protein [Chloroflexota bacterium]